MRATEQRILSRITIRRFRAKAQNLETITNPRLKPRVSKHFAAKGLQPLTAF